MANKPSAPVMNPIEQSGTDYLQMHRIYDLFHNLSASLVYNKPGNEKNTFILLIITSYCKLFAKID